MAIIYYFLRFGGLLECFGITSVEEKSKEIVIHLEKKNNIDTSDSSVNLESKGFYFPVLVSGFPIRSRRLLLEIKRRRWIK